jgi:predicted enzyme related to lactoylglutathione lyase
MPRVVHNEIHAENPERAITFYRQVLGWEFSKWSGPEDYWLIMTGPDSQPGINGGMLRRRGAAPAEGQPVNAFVCTVDVPAIDEYIGKVAFQGGSIALPKMAVPGIGWLAYAKDTEGNIFGMMQRDPAAK